MIIAEEDGTPAGFALFFHNYSTFLAQPGIYLEDLFVKPEYRGRGYGKALLARLAQIARERNCGRVEWAVLDWNEPSIAFYKSLGARKMDEWHDVPVDGAGAGAIGKKHLNHKDTKRYPSCPLCLWGILRPQRFDRLQPRGADRRIQARQQSDRDRRSRWRPTGRTSETGKPAGKKPEITFTTPMPPPTPIGGADDGERDRLDQELHEDLAVARADRFAQADLEQALGDRDLEHGEDADAADEQRDAGDGEEDDAPVAQDA